MSNKDEDAFMIRFVDFLKANEGIEYQKVAQDVPNRTGVKNFDYLLISPEGRKLALEVTTLNDEPISLGHSGQFNEVWRKVSKLHFQRRNFGCFSRLHS
jgi:transcriptional antiterminator Rof (Rho-off)